MSTLDAAIGFESAAPRMRMPYSVSMPRTLRIATPLTLPVVRLGGPPLPHRGQHACGVTLVELQHRHGHRHPLPLRVLRVVARREAVPRAGIGPAVRRRRLRVRIVRE